MAETDVRYLVFDVESVADGDLIAKVRFAGEPLSAEQAIAQYRADLIEDQGTDFIPYTFQIPAAVVVAKVAADFELIDVVALDDPCWRPHISVSHFWRGWEKYGQPTLVSFNGRTFDLPLLELAAYRFGISIPKWFDTSGRTWDQPRNRYNTHAHLDLQEMLTNMGASRFSGGLHVAASLIGRPGKMDIAGFMVQDMFDAGRLREIVDYCRCDVLDTYFVFLRTMVLLGRLTVDREQELVAAATSWIAERADEIPVYHQYLEWSSGWVNPWQQESQATAVG
jgi:predicted PolB exonuclease-like 3'-5' exonuclease